MVSKNSSKWPTVICYHLSFLFSFDFPLRLTLGRLVWIVHRSYKNTMFFSVLFPWLSSTQYFTPIAIVINKISCLLHFLFLDDFASLLACCLPRSETQVPNDSQHIYMYIYIICMYIYRTPHLHEIFEHRPKKSKSGGNLEAAFGVVKKETSRSRLKACMGIPWISINPRGLLAQEFLLLVPEQ